VAFAFDGIYKGLGNGTILRNVLLVSTFGIFVPVILLTDHPGWQLFAVRTAFLVWMVVRCGQLALDFNRHYGAHAVH
jgi:Na+-driven multidrug efflux pump